MILHIWSQYAEHSEAFILGNREGLLALREAIDKALDVGQAHAMTFCTDGEGFDTLVVCEDSDWQGPVWQEQKLPYTRFSSDPSYPPQDGQGPWDLPQAKQLYREMQNG
jgi:hypothetical protein